MAGPMRTKRKAGESMKGRPKKLVKKFKKQTDYDSGSGDDSDNGDKQDFAAVNLADSDEEEESAPVKLSTHVAADSDNEEENDEPNLDEASASDVTDASNSDSDSDADMSDADTNPNNVKIRNKRNDPDAFATSMSKILGSKLSTSKRSDPVLSRSVNALQASKEIIDQALEKKAKQKLREEKRQAMDKGRVKDVLGASTAFDAANKEEGVPTATVQQTMEEEKRLRKTAQRGVVRMFNAVRSAQIKGEQAAKDARLKGVVGHGRREEKVNEMSKQGFLALIAGGSGGLPTGGIEEA
ncbi:pre-60S ribosomal particles component [Pseudogymnoascus australis]